MAPAKLGRRPRTLQMTDENYAALQLMASKSGIKLSDYMHFLSIYAVSADLRFGISASNMPQNIAILPSELRSTEVAGTDNPASDQPDSDGRIGSNEHFEANSSRTHADKTLLSLQDSSTTAPFPLPSQEKAKEETILVKSVPPGASNGVSNSGDPEPTLFDSQLPPATESPAPSKEAKGKGSRKRGPARPYPEDFLAWWEDYPKRVGKGNAHEAWEKMAVVRPPLPQMLSTLEWQVKCKQWQTYDYIPYPSSYLNGKFWEDEPEQPIVPPPVTPPPKRVLPLPVAREQAISLLARSARLHGHALEEESFAAVEAAQDQAALDAIVRDYEQRELGRSGNGKPAQPQAGTVAGEGTEPVVLAALGAGGVGGLHVARPG